MAAFVKYETFVTDLATGTHGNALDAPGDTDTLKVALTNTAPVVATHTVLANITEIAGGAGYTAGGIDTVNTSSKTTGTITVASADKVTWTSTGAGMATFRYVVLYNDTPTSPADPLIGYWDYTSAVDLAASETFTADFGASLFTIA